MEPVTLLEPIIAASARANAEVPGDYTQEGILYCGACKTPKQCKISLFGGERIVPCLCRCRKEKQEREEAEARRKEEADRIMRLRSTGIVSSAFRAASFDRDDGKNPGPMKTVRKFSQNWEKFYRENIGLLLYGGVGTGKSYAAACVANELIDRSTPVYMDNFAGILNTITGIPLEEKNGFISDLMHYPLLILDDFGMERKTDYAMEQIFNIVDSRYRSGKPLIVTTNLTVDDLRNPKSIEFERIYDRVLEMCQPVNFGNSGRRAGIARQKMRMARDLLAQPVDEEE